MAARGREEGILQLSMADAAELVWRSVRFTNKHDLIDRIDESPNGTVSGTNEVITEAVRKAYQEVREHFRPEWPEDPLQLHYLSAVRVAGVEDINKKSEQDAHETLYNTVCYIWDVHRELLLGSVPQNWAVNEGVSTIQFKDALVAGSGYEYDSDDEDDRIVNLDGSRYTGPRATFARIDGVASLAAHLSQRQ